MWKSNTLSPVLIINRTAGLCQITQHSLVHEVICLQWGCEIRSVNADLILTGAQFCGKRMWYPGLFSTLWFLSVTLSASLLFWIRRMQGVFPAWPPVCLPFINLSVYRNVNIIHRSCRVEEVRVTLHFQSNGGTSQCFIDSSTICIHTI